MLIFILRMVLLIMEFIEKDLIDINIPIPKNSIVFDLDGKYIYPSFIETHSSFGIKKPKEEVQVEVLNMNHQEVVIIGMIIFLVITTVLMITIIAKRCKN